MKKILFSFVLFLFGGMTVFAMSYYGDLFKDDGSIADWAKTSVYNMKQAGIINGYSDGSFGPDKYVTRAEFATMLDRYSSNIVNQNIYQFIYALNRRGYIDLNGDDVNSQAAVLAADAGFFLLDKAPAGWNNGKPNADEFSLIDDKTLPDGYSYYQQVPYEFYLRYKGDRYVGQDSIPVDEWFGPFSVYDNAYRR